MKLRTYEFDKNIKKDFSKTTLNNFEKNLSDSYKKLFKLDRIPSDEYNIIKSVPNYNKMNPNLFVVAFFVIKTMNEENLNLNDAVIKNIDVVLNLGVIRKAKRKKEKTTDMFKKSLGLDIIRYYNKIQRFK